MQEGNTSNRIIIIICTVFLSLFLIAVGVLLDRYVLSCDKNDKNEIEINTAITPSKREDIIPIEKAETVSPMEITEVVTPTEKAEAVTPTEKAEAVTPTEKAEAVTPTEKAELVTPTEKAEAVTPTENDKRVIPDKYNTGCKGNLVEVTDTIIIEGITFQNRDNILVVDYYYVNNIESGTYVIENYDFSNMQLRFYYEEPVTDKDIKIFFNNCKFHSVSTMRPISESFSYTFNNCTFNIFSGSNSTFNRCRFGDSYVDAMIPYSNVTVNDCYFANLASSDPKGNGAHSDGVQMYGYADSMVQNVMFSNCRFEIPAVYSQYSSAAVNACIMLGLEFNDGKNIRIEDCILNGGGYTVYAGGGESYVLSEVYFTNIKIGAAMLFGTLYPRYDEKIVFTNFEEQDSLYVSSVWNDGNKTHVIVSNDTAKQRVLRVVTGTGIEDFIIEACLGGNTLRYDVLDVPFEEFPFDVDISVEANADYVICFDVTDGIEKQIRYVSFDGKPTYYDIKTDTS